MQHYISYEVFLEERITADREIAVLVEKLGAAAAAVWNRLRRWLFNFDDANCWMRAYRFAQTHSVVTSPGRLDLE